MLYCYSSSFKNDSVVNLDGCETSMENSCNIQRNMSKNSTCFDIDQQSHSTMNYNITLGIH